MLSVSAILAVWRQLCSLGVLKAALYLCSPVTVGLAGLSHHLFMIKWNFDSNVCLSSSYRVYIFSCLNSHCPNLHHHQDIEVWHTALMWAEKCVQIKYIVAQWISIATIDETMNFKIRFWFFFLLDFLVTFCILCIIKIF